MQGVVRSILLFGLLFNIQAASQPLWETLSPLPDVSPINSLAFGVGRFAAATSDGLAFSRDNGLTWTNSPTAATGKYNDLLYASDLFVAVGDAGMIQTSVDGMT